MEKQDSVCPSCPESNINYFIEGQIGAQIKALFKRPGFQTSLQHRHTRDCVNNVDNYADIYDSAVYKDLSQHGAFLDNSANISLTWYTDRICIFKSSKFSIRVLYLVINELPSSERNKKENVFIPGLWFGDLKPIPNLFLVPLQKIVTELNRGIDVQLPNSKVLNIKGIVISGTCDLPAKALFLNMKLYNGKFGCHKCKQKGKYLPNHKVRVYPYEPINLRIDEETQIHARQAFDVRTAVCGVKGPTILSTIMHQHIRGIAVDGVSSKESNRKIV